MECLQQLLQRNWPITVILHYVSGTLGIAGTDLGSRMLNCPRTLTELTWLLELTSFYSSTALFSAVHCYGGRLVSKLHSGAVARVRSFIWVWYGVLFGYGLFIRAKRSCFMFRHVTWNRTCKNLLVPNTNTADRVQRECMCDFYLMRIFPLPWDLNS